MSNDSKLKFIVKTFQEFIEEKTNIKIGSFSRYETLDSSTSTLHALHILIVDR